MSHLTKLLNFCSLVACVLWMCCVARSPCRRLCCVRCQDEKEEALESAMGKKGFGKAPVSFEAIFDKENYVARPADDVAWKAYIDQELSDALKQVGTYMPSL